VLIMRPQNGPVVLPQMCDECGVPVERYNWLRKTGVLTVGQEPVPVCPSRVLRR